MRLRLSAHLYPPLQEVFQGYSLSMVAREKDGGGSLHDAQLRPLHHRDCTDVRIQERIPPGEFVQQTFRYFTTEMQIVQRYLTLPFHSMNVTHNLCLIPGQL